MIFYITKLISIINEMLLKFAIKCSSNSPPQTKKKKIASFVHKKLEENIFERAFQ